MCRARRGVLGMRAQGPEGGKSWRQHKRWGHLRHPKARTNCPSTSTTYLCQFVCCQRHTKCFGVDMKAMTLPQRAPPPQYPPCPSLPMALQEAQRAPPAACHSIVHFTLKKHVNVCDFCCTRAIKERSTSETCSEAVLKVPIIFYNVEELIKEQAKRMLFVITRRWGGKR